MTDFWDCKDENRGEEIICPYCKTEQEQETKYHHVTYWGEDSHKECTCESCGKDFMVIEKVTREFATYEELTKKVSEDKI